MAEDSRAQRVAGFSRQCLEAAQQAHAVHASGHRRFLVPTDPMSKKFVSRAPSHRQCKLRTPLKTGPVPVPEPILVSDDSWRCVAAEDSDDDTCVVKDEPTDHTSDVQESEPSPVMNIQIKTEVRSLDCPEHDALDPDDDFSGVGPTQSIEAVLLMMEQDVDHELVPLTHPDPGSYDHNVSSLESFPWPFREPRPSAHFHTGTDLPCSFAPPISHAHRADLRALHDMFTRDPLEGLRHLCHGLGTVDIATARLPVGLLKGSVPRFRNNSRRPHVPHSPAARPAVDGTATNTAKLQETL